MVLKDRATVVAIGIVILAAAFSGLAWVKTAAILKADGDDSWPFLIYLGVWLLFLWIQLKIAPRFCTVRTLHGGESVFFPLDE